MAGTPLSRPRRLSRRERAESSVMAKKPTKHKKKGRRKLTKAEQECVSRKIHIIHSEEPSKSHDAVVGKAVGMCKRLHETMHGGS